MLGHTYTTTTKDKHGRNGKRGKRKIGTVANVKLVKLEVCHNDTATVTVGWRCEDESFFRHGMTATVVPEMA